MTKEMFQKTVLTQINGDKNHGWGVEDCLTVVKAIVNDKNGKSLDDVSWAQVKSMINPSQYRQILEDQKVLNLSPKGSKKVKQDFNVFNVEATPAK